jgi:hypothetical protein
VLDEGLGVTGLELGVELHRQSRSIFPIDHSRRGEGIAGEYPGARRRNHDLVLVRDGDADRRGRRFAHPRRAVPQFVVLEADPPAALGLLDPAAERLRHRLVAEADADQPGAPLRLAKEAQQGRDPGQGLVDARGRAGDQEGRVRLGRGRRLAALDVIGTDPEARAEQPLEHAVIGAEAVGEVRRRCAGAKEADFHAAPPRVRTQDPQSAVLAAGLLREIPASAGIAYGP